MEGKKNKYEKVPNYITYIYKIPAELWKCKDLNTRYYK